MEAQQEQTKIFKLPDWETVWQKIGSEEIVKIQRTANDKKCLYNFVNKLSKRINLNAIGPDFVSQYVCFQLARLLNYQETKTYSGKIDCPSIFGEKAVGYFWDRNVFGEWKKHHINEEITPERIRQWISWTVDNSDTLHGMDLVEKNFHRKALLINEESRIEFCKATTTLFREGDVNCEKCSIKVGCRKEQVRMFPYTKKKAKV